MRCWRLDALTRLFDKAVRHVWRQFINHVTGETEMYHHAVVLMLAINSSITARSNWIRRSLTQQGRLSSSGTVALRCLTLLPPRKTRKLLVKICSKDRWETVVLLEFHYRVWNQNKQGYVSRRGGICGSSIHIKKYIYSVWKHPLQLI